MSDAPSPALEELDRRGRAAAAALRARIDVLVDDDAGAAPGREPDGSADGPDDFVMDLDRPGADGRPRHPGRWLAVAAALLLAAAVAAMVMREPRTTVSSDMPSYVVPGYVPSGMQLTWAIEFDGTGDPGAVGTFDMQLAVYGEPGASDAWANTLVVMVGGGDVDPVDGESVTVDGRDATLRRTEGSAAGGGPSWQVSWTADGDRVLVAGSAGLTRDQVIAAAEARDGVAIGAAGLPDGFALLARGPIDAVDPSGLATPAFPSGLALTYRPPGAGDGGPALSLLQRPGEAEAIDLLRAAFPDADDITVRGHDGVIGRRDDQVAIQWLEADQLATVVATGVDEAEVIAFAEGLRVARPGEVERLIAQSPDWAAVPEGQVEVTSGRAPSGAPWRVTAAADGPENISGLTFELGVGATASAGAAGASDGSPLPPLDLATEQFTDDDLVVFGTADPAAASVSLEAPGRPPLPLDLHAIDGWDRRVYAVALGPDDAAGAVVVARQADGRELARAELP